MDYVITYVNNQDPEWVKQYLKYKSDVPIDGARFRDWGLLKYHLRGIEKNLPWINNVYLVVASKSQVPEWINTEKVHIVTHDQIIPKNFLPTFNSTCIEMFLKNIPGLDEYFIYANDDMYPVKPLVLTDYVRDEKPCVHLMKKERSNATSQFRKVIIGCQNLILDDYENYPRPLFQKYYRPEHFPICQTKTAHERVWKNHQEDIFKSISRFRDIRNYNQYIFIFDQVFSGESVDIPVDGKYMDFGSKDMFYIKHEIEEPSYKILCVNDNKKAPENAGEEIRKSFQKLLPQKSKYEN